MKVDIGNINVGDYIFIGSRWHRVSAVERKGDTYEVRDYSYGYGSDKMTTKTYTTDMIRIGCTYENYLQPYSFKKGNYSRPLPDAEYVKPKDSAFPKCKFCEGTAGRGVNSKPRGNYILFSEIADIPEVRAKIEKKFNYTTYNGHTYSRVPRFRVIDDRVKE